MDQLELSVNQGETDERRIPLVVGVEVWRASPDPTEIVRPDATAGPNPSPNCRDDSMAKL